MATKGTLLKKQIKKGLDGSDCRRRRNETSVQIRKTKREEGLAKRRNLPTDVPQFDSQDQASSQSNTVATQASIAELPQYVKGVHSSEAQLRYEATRSIRKLLSVETSPPVRAVIDSGVLPTIISFLSINGEPRLQFEAAWVLTNVASTTMTKLVVELGALPFLLPLLTCSNADVREQAIWCVGNISGDCAELRDSCLAHGALEWILLNIQQPASMSLLRNATWVLSNLCRGKPAPHIDSVKPAIPALAALLKHEDKEVVTDACWALSYLSDGDDARIQAVVEAGVTPELLRLMTSATNETITPALRTIGNIVSGSEHLTQSVIDSGAIPVLSSLLENPKTSIRKEACWALSNIAAGTQAQIKALVETPQTLEAVIQQLGTAEWDVKKEALWVVANIAISGTKAQIKRVIDLGAIEHFCYFLEVEDAKLINLALEALESILKLGAQDNSDYQSMIDEVGGLNKLENLQNHENLGIYEKAVSIIENFFGVDEEEEDENVAPEWDGNNFGFGANTAIPSGGFNFGSGAF